MRLVIIGAGHAGGSVAALLRQFGWPGEIIIVGSEPLAPYQRPPLSKAWLKGEVDAEALILKPESWYADNQIDLRLRSTAVSIDRRASHVNLADGSILPFDLLILATGARARPLAAPGARLDHVHALRSAADADRLKAAIVPSARLAVIGGGYVGLEVAASASALGAEVVVIEREPRLLARVACAELSGFYADQHQRHGVGLELGAQVAGLVGEGGRVAAVRLEDRRELPCDVVLVGVGAIANDELAQEAGLDCDGGVLVDLECRTSDPRIFAIGDVTRRPIPACDAIRVRVESVPNALEQAKQAASAIAGRPPPKAEVPWFWSDQFDLKLQMAGLAQSGDVRVVRGDVAAGRFAVFHLRDDTVGAVEAVNAPPEFMMGRQLIAKRTPVVAQRLADPSISMKDVARP